ncbi:MAG: hypothetical protein RIK87_24695 [Fuerstiella sp.]
MSDMSTKELIERLDEARATLAELPSHIDQEPAIQAALTELMQAEHYIVAKFRQLSLARPDVAVKVLMSAVSALVSLHEVDAITAELRRRADQN